jgi:hypothetical protein
MNMEAPSSTIADDFTGATETNVLAELYEALDSRPKDVNLHEMVIDGWLAIRELGKCTA